MTFIASIHIFLPLCHQQKGEVALAILKDIQVFVTWSYIFITTYKHKSIVIFLSSIMAIHHLLLVQNCTLLFFAMCMIVFLCNIQNSKLYIMLASILKMFKTVSFSSLLRSVSFYLFLYCASNLSPPLSLSKRREKPFTSISKSWQR